MLAKLKHHLKTDSGEWSHLSRQTARYLSFLMMAVAGGGLGIGMHPEKVPFLTSAATHTLFVVGVLAFVLAFAFAVIGYPRTSQGGTR
jgi:hypothetical protein